MSRPIPLDAASQQFQGGGFGLSAFRRRAEAGREKLGSAARASFSPSNAPLAR
jgi:hypothetical protein